MPPGEIVTGKMTSALRDLGFDAVMDPDFTADLTIMEEGTELVKRLTKGTGVLPQITSCSSTGALNLLRASPAPIAPAKSPQYGA